MIAFGSHKLMNLRGFGTLGVPKIVTIHNIYEINEYWFFWQGVAMIFRVGSNAPIRSPRPFIQKDTMEFTLCHYTDVIMGAMASQITCVSIVYSIFCSDADQRKYQSSPSLTFVRGIHRWPVNSPYKGAVTRKMFPLDDVIMCTSVLLVIWGPLE